MKRSERHPEPSTGSARGTLARLKYSAIGVKTQDLWPVDPVDDEIFDSPEAAALVDYPPAARARVVKVRYKRRGKEAIVEITTDPDDAYFVHVERTPGGWIPTLGHN